MQNGTTKRVIGILKSTLNRLHVSEPLGLSEIFCDVLKHFNTDHLTPSEQIYLSTHLLDHGVLDIVIDLLSSLTFDLATYVNLVTLSVTLLTATSDPDRMGVGEDKLSKIVEYLLTAAHNALSVLLSNLNETEQDLFPVISSCLSLLQELAANFPVVRILAINSYSFLHLVVEDDGTVTHPILTCLFSLLEMCKDELQSIKQKTIHNILDELVLKLSQSDPSIVCKSLECIQIILSNCPQLQPDRLSRRYKGVVNILKKWIGNEFDGLIDDVIILLEPNFKKFENREERAAQIIQSLWRGHLVREKLSGYKEAAIILQRRFRSKKWMIEFTHRCEKAKRLKLLRKEERMREESIQTQIEFFKTIERLPARKIRTFLAGRQIKAALTIQQWWRRQVRRKTLRQLREKRIFAAVRIQRWIRRFLAKQKCEHAILYDGDLGSAVIEDEITLFRESRRRRKVYSEEELERIELKVTELFLEEPLDYSRKRKLLHVCNDLLEIIEDKFIP